MFRDISPTWLLIVGIVFFALVVAGTQLYSWHVRRTTEVGLERHDQFLQGLENKNEARFVQGVNLPTENETLGETPKEIDEPQMSGNMDVLPIDKASEFADVADVFFSDDFVSEAAEAEDVSVSPFGFGPYPEVPDDYFGIPVWMQNANLPDSTQKNVELIDRVLIKLWQQGDKAIVGGSTYRGKVYPHYEDTVYIRWTASTASDGTPYRYISRRKGASLLPTSEDIENGDIPPGFKIIELDDAGYDPYTFLDLQ